MRRLTITLENYDDSKIVCSSLLDNETERGAISDILGRSTIEYSIEEVEGVLYNFHLDDGDRYIDLALRTKDEVKEWIRLESFEATVKSFLDSHNVSLRVSVGPRDEYLKIERCTV
jgi:hypothetical protein